MVFVHSHWATYLTAAWTEIKMKSSDTCNWPFDTAWLTLRHVPKIWIVISWLELIVKFWCLDHWSNLSNEDICCQILVTHDQLESIFGESNTALLTRALSLPRTGGGGSYRTACVCSRMRAALILLNTMSERNTRAVPSSQETDFS